MVALCVAAQSGGSSLQAADPESQLPEGLQCPSECIGADHPTAYNKASRLIGMKVHDPAGQPLGRIKDIVIDGQRERVSYAVLAVHRGFLGLNQKLLAVPLGAFQPGEQRNRLVLNADRKSLDLAQGFSAGQWPSPTAPSWGAAAPWKEGSAMTEVDATKMKSQKSETARLKRHKAEVTEHEPTNPLAYPGF
jgi:sporulation protein YlmC with PRC-barrel domain